MPHVEVWQAKVMKPIGRMKDQGKLNRVRSMVCKNVGEFSDDFKHLRVLRSRLVGLRRGSAVGAARPPRRRRRGAVMHHNGEGNTDALRTRRRYPWVDGTVGYGRA